MKSTSLSTKLIMILLLLAVIGYFAVQGYNYLVSPETADAALSALKAEGIDAYVCGEIVPGEDQVVLV